MFYDIFFLSCSANSSVKESIYSISTPSGIPCAILETIILLSSLILFISSKENPKSVSETHQEIVARMMFSFFQPSTSVFGCTTN